MRERLGITHKSAQRSGYWQCEICFGLPFAILFCGTDYVAFRLTSGKWGSRYPSSIADMLGWAGTVLLVSAL